MGWHTQSLSVPNPMLHWKDFSTRHTCPHTEYICLPLQNAPTTAVYLRPCAMWIKRYWWTVVEICINKALRKRWEPDCNVMYMLKGSPTLVLVCLVERNVHVCGGRGLRRRRRKTGWMSRALEWKDAASHQSPENRAVISMRFSPKSTSSPTPVLFQLLLCLPFPMPVFKNR